MPQDPSLLSCHKCEPWGWPGDWQVGCRSTEWTAYWGLRNLQVRKGVGVSQVAQAWWGSIKVSRKGSGVVCTWVRILQLTSSETLRRIKKTQSGQVPASCFTDTDTGPPCSTFHTQSQPMRQLPHHPGE